MAAGSTYTPISSQTLGSAAASITFSSIPSTYTDLVLVISPIVATNDQSIYAQVNSDTNTNYSITWLAGNGTTAASGRTTNASYAIIGGVQSYGGSTTTPSIMIANFMNYANSTTYKTILNRATMFRNDGNGETDAIVSLWRSTAVINAIKIYAQTGNLATGTTATLYGIAAA